MAELAADFTFCHRSSDQDYLEIAPNDVDGLVTSRRYLVYNSWYRKLGAFRDLVPVSASSLQNPYDSTSRADQDLNRYQITQDTGRE